MSKVSGPLEKNNVHIHRADVIIDTNRPRDEVLADADALIDELGLTPRRHHLPKQLSAGEQQRTALARALLAEPTLLLADEPTGNLDGENARHVLDQMRAFADSGGTVLVATHDSAAATAADRRLQLSDGRLADD